MHKGRVFRVVFVALVTISLLTSCSQETTSTPTISSAQSISIEPTEMPTATKVIAIANGSAEIISALGQKSIIIGRDIASTDKDLKSIEIVTSGHQLIAETIIAKQPDLLLIDDSTGPAQALKIIRASGIKIVTIPESWSVGDISKKVTAVAAAIGTPGDGAALNSEITAAQAAITPVGEKTKIAFLYLRGGSAIYLIGGQGSGADSLIQAVGAVDVGAKSLPNAFNALTAESMVAINPDVIMVMKKGLASIGGVEGLIALPGIAQTNAAKNRKIIAVDDSLLLSFGPRTSDLLKQLALEVSKMVAP